MSKIRYIYLGDLHDQLMGDRFTRKGGVARLATVFKQLEEEARAEGYEPVIVGIGDYIGQGPLAVYMKGEPAFDVAEKLGIQVSAIGNSEFNHGVERLTKLMADHSTIQFLAANLDFTHEPELGKPVKPFMVKNIGGEKVAFIGLTTPEIKKLGSTKTGEIEIQDDLEQSLLTAIEHAQDEGARTFVVLSHVGLAKDKELAQMCVDRGLDVVFLGGHTHTTLGDLPAETFGGSKGKYPEVRSEKGHMALVTNTPHHGQAATYLDVEYDDKGHIVSFSRNSTIVIDESITPDPSMQECVERHQKDLPDFMFDEVGRAEVSLLGLDGQPPYAREELEDCIRQEETPLGNLAADALYFGAEQLEQKEGRHVDFAFAHAGGIRTDIPKGPILVQDLYSMHPFDEQNIVVVELTGHQIKAMLEECVFGEDFHRRGEFAIGSEGFGYSYKIYDEAEEVVPRGKRISDVTLNGVPLEDDKTYRVATNAFLAYMNNCDGHTGVLQQIIEGYKANGMSDSFREYDSSDRDALIGYMKKYKPTLDGRLSETPRIIYQGRSCLDKHCPEGTPYQDRYIAALRTLKLRSLQQARDEAVREEPPVSGMSPRRG